ncbi:hypothetical protein PRZ48_015234 [Zasmidium cellare]|uniref:Mediator of RNA polymerase II transcription subunit 17 n=1 Tax=Zasmidium cellare TaxID=395010 RepID=A0ABR0DY24_ZASCE|nr:hypothetical protein PRZ48_015234 [Zasmidium cellare]
MSATSTTTSLTFKPWTTENGDEPSLKDILGRIETERGQFRHVTEASLQEDIAAEGALELSSNDDEEDEQDEGEGGVAKRQPANDRAELWRAKQEMGSYLNEALRNSHQSLKFVALLQSKYQRSIAASSLGDMKDKVPYGSISGDVWDPERAMPKDAARENQDGLLATSVRMRELQQSADGLLAAATQLKENVRQETLFWDEILSVTERGWRISKISGTPLLGVRYGFQGSDAAFANSQVAAITSDSEGNVMLERGLGTRPKAIRTILRQEGHVIGSSALPRVPDESETTLEARIRHARDSVFDEELFHEMLRESRSLISEGVTTKDSAVYFTTELSQGLEVELQLVSLDEDNSLGLEASHDLDTIAHAILLTARLLLGQGHRNKLNRMKEIPPPLSKKEDDDRQNTAILRPLTLVQLLNAYLDKMCNLLRTAGVSAESQPGRLSLPVAANGSIDVQDLVTSLMKPFKAESVLWLIASDALTLEMKLTAESFVWNTPGSTFTIHPPGGQTVRLFSIDELFLAANDFLALALAQLLKELVGHEWSLDRREGTLTRTREVSEKEVLKFGIDEGCSAVTLRSLGSHGRKEVLWISDGSSETKPLSEAWKELVN